MNSVNQYHNPQVDTQFLGATIGVRQEIDTKMGNDATQQKQGANWGVQFVGHLQEGRLGECLAYRLHYRDNHPRCEIVKGKDTRGDIWIPEAELYLAEVKLDVMSEATGNIAIEFMGNYNGKKVKSGISVTQAGEWVHIFYSPKAKSWVMWISGVYDLKKRLKDGLKEKYCTIKRNVGYEGSADVILMKADDSWGKGKMGKYIKVTDEDMKLAQRDVTILELCEL